MSLRSLLRKELLWSRHRLLTLAFLLLVLPGFFAASTVAFGTVVPEDSPVAIVAGDDAVTEDELTIIKGGAAVFSDPELYDDRATAMRALERESVYAVVEVPSGIMNESRTNATFRLYVDGSIVPFKEPSKALRGIMAFYLNGNLPADVNVERVVVGDERTLSEYLVPVFLMGMVLLFAFAYLPYALARESAVLDRLRVESSLDAVVATKIGYTALLLFVPIVAFQGVATWLAYGVSLLAPGAVAVYLLTFCYLAAIAASVMLLTDFGTLGRFLNVSLMLGAFTFGSLVFPVGFFSPLRKEIARLVPLHYSMIVTRSLTLKEAEIGLFADWIAGLVGFTICTALLLKLAIVYYERGR